MSRVELIGYLGRDAELKYGPSGSAFVKFSVAHNPYVRDGQQERTDWYAVTSFRNAEKIHPYLVKGTAVFVRGDLAYRAYTNKDGQPGYSLDVLASEVELIGARAEGQSPSTAKPAAAEWDALADGEVPF